uniref:Palmitoyltransferase n=1 Tax=Globodera rostochiensis TaxID=31243 RepID=A0A914I9R0_GLORO
MVLHHMYASTSNGLSCIWRMINTDDHDCDEWSANAEDKQLSPAYHWCHWGPISATLIVVIIGLSTSIVHVSWWDITTFSGALDFMLFLFWNYMVLRYMYLACMLGPGFSKIGWHPEEDEHWKYFRYCYRCRRCVLLMDHHCPWINNCVGQRNQIYFVKFLFFAIVGSAHAAIVLTSCLYKVIFAFVLLSNSENEQRQHLQHLPELPIDSIYLFIFSVLAVGLAYGVVIAVGILLIVQLRSVYLDRTGIESLKRK